MRLKSLMKLKKLIRFDAGDTLKKWVPYTYDYKNLEVLMNELNISEIMARVLINRGINTKEEAEEFLGSTLNSLHTPFDMLGMNKAILRVEQALKDKEKICIYGDYDVDGITSVALLCNFFKKYDLDVIYYIPNRLEEGYGLNIEAIKKLIQKEINLIITVDCGIRSVEEVKYANDAGVDTIITDHHKCGEYLPDAYAIINPNQSNCAYPFKHLAGAGIAFKLITALSHRFSYEDDIMDMLDLVALATVADAVPLFGENRTIVKNGLETIKNTKNIGLSALLSVSNIDLSELNVYHLGFIIAPRLNAAGRLKDASIAVEMFTTDDFDKALEIAKELDELNTMRQNVESSMLDSALEIIDKEVDLKTERILVLENKAWHLGVLGIIASRITERFNKPSIIIATDGGLGKGSARSINGLNIYEIISQCEEMLVKFGGHELAAGLTIEENLIGKFRSRINEIAVEMQGIKEQPPEVLVDYKLDNSDDLMSVFNDVKKLEPYGYGNPKPVFVYRNMGIKDKRTVGNEGKHLSLKLFNGVNNIDAIGFNMGFMYNNIAVNQFIDIIFSVELNVWNGKESIQFFIKDIKPSKR